MNVFAIFAAELNQIVGRLAEGSHPGGTLAGQVTIEPPRDSAHGDLATNAAMILAKKLRKAPRDIAGDVAAELEKLPGVAEAVVAGPGFVNIRLKTDYWQRFLTHILRLGGDYGRSDYGAGQLVNVEFVSANPTGPLHVGHCRGAIFGDALVRLLRFAGYTVTAEYYINDAGSQVDILARSAYLRYREALGDDIEEIGEGLYPGDYLKKVGDAIAAEYGRSLLSDREELWIGTIRQYAVDRMLSLIRDDLAMLDIHHDVFFSERAMTADGGDKIAEAINHLSEDGLIYMGALPPPKGEVSANWERREQLLFRATQYGDDIDRALRKPDGSYTYFAADIAYHFDKFKRGFLKQIDVLGADHGGYVKRVQAALNALSGDKAQLEARVCQMVNLLRDGRPVKMSKRAGDFITLREVIDEVGRDALRFMMLTRKNDAQLDFDFVKVKEMTRDNPVFYVQYAHARIQSVRRNAVSAMKNVDLEVETLSNTELSDLSDIGELGLIKLLAQYPRMIEHAAIAREPHRVAFYLYDLATAFHAHWNRGKELTQLRFINPEDTSLTLARLALISAVALVLRNGLDILGVEAVDEM